jgi:hypothetical protein
VRVEAPDVREASLEGAPGRPAGPGVCALGDHGVVAVDDRVERDGETVHEVVRRTEDVRDDGIGADVVAERQ